MRPIDSTARDRWRSDPVLQLRRTVPASSCDGSYARILCQMFIHILGGVYIKGADNLVLGVYYPNSQFPILPIRESL
jgi:hypothetical protein